MLGLKLNHVSQKGPQVISEIAARTRAPADTILLNIFTFPIWEFVMFLLC